MAEAVRPVKKRALVFAAAAMLLAACARDPRQALPGEWRSGSARLVFYRDGQVLMEGDSAATMARYDILEKHRVRIRSLAAEPAVYDVHLKGDSLVMCRTDDPARCYRMRRSGGE
jgi:hypothetical protein